MKQVSKELLYIDSIIENICSPKIYDWLFAVAEQEAISAIKKRLLEDISFTKLERRPSAVMMQEIIKEAESQDEGLWSSASDIDDKEKFIISEGGVVDVRLVESVLDSDFINQEDDDALLEFDSWAIDKPADPAADADCVVYVVYSERLQLSELVGDEFLDVFDISMDDFTDQLGEELDKLSEKVMEDHEGSDQESEGCDRLTPGSKARECVAALAFLGF